MEESFVVSIRYLAACQLESIHPHAVYRALAIEARGVAHVEPAFGNARHRGLESGRKQFAQGHRFHLSTGGKAPVSLLDPRESRRCAALSMTIFNSQLGKNGLTFAILREAANFCVAPTLGN